MAHLAPFPGLRYDPTLVVANDVVSPPYDVVGPTERAELAAKSPYNAINVELPVADPLTGLDSYENAARIVDRWTRAGVLKADPRACLYLYRMSYLDAEQRPRSTTGVLGALGIDLDGPCEVLPHEQTVPKDRADRLSLLRSTRLNTSPIWVLSPVDGLTSACNELAAQSDGPSWRAKDAAGVLHEIWPVAAERDIANLAGLVATAPVLIADGHHRYRTACAYDAECRKLGRELPGTNDHVLALVVELSADQLRVGAIHRLVKGLEPGLIEDKLASYFSVEDAPDPLPDLTTMPSGTIVFGSEQGFKLLRALPALAQAAEDDLDSSRLAVALADLPALEVSYEPSFDAALDALREGRAQGAFLLNPVSVERIRQVAHGGRLMAPKTTYFAPKPLTGMVFRSLDER
jgi:uncharacterized protein (DUF1015 family)